MLRANGAHEGKRLLRPNLLYDINQKTMRTFGTIFFALTFCIFSACNTSQSPDQEQETPKAAKKETPKKAENKENNEASAARPQQDQATDEQVMIASFEGLVIKDGEGFYVYKDKQGEKHHFEEGGFPYSYVMVNYLEPVPAFLLKNFKIRYSDDEALAIESIQEINNAGKPYKPTLALNMQDLTHAVFFGATEENWSLKFKPGEAIYTPNIGEEPQHLMYQTGGGKHPKIHAINENQVRIRTSAQGGYEYLYVIKKKDCSDGMSENTYPYAITIYRQGVESGWEKLGSGCGRIKD